MTAAWQSLEHCRTQYSVAQESSLPGLWRQAMDRGKVLWEEEEEEEEEWEEEEEE